MNRGRDVILVTGATGQQGGATARELLGGGHRVRALTRKPNSEPARALARAGAEVVSGDFNDAESLRRALAGAWGVFAVQNSWEAGVEAEEAQGKHLAELAKAVGVQHFVYTSVGSAHRATGIPHFDSKWRIEEAVRNQGFPSNAVLRPVFFMENWTSPGFRPAILGGTLAIGIKPTTGLHQIALADIGRYAALAFERHAELNGKAIDIAGDVLTPVETAAAISAVLGRTVTHYQVPIEEVRKFSADFATMLEWFDRVGYEVDIEANARTYGIPPTRFRDWVKTADWS